MLMMLYRLVAVGLLGMMVMFNYFGMTFFAPEKVTGVPKTLRQNPGSYRSHYQSHYVHVGGK